MISLSPPGSQRIIYLKNLNLVTSARSLLPWKVIGSVDWDLDVFVGRVLPTIVGLWEDYLGSY